MVRFENLFVGCVVNLNKNQKSYVDSSHLLNIVSAGAGTGKTGTVIERARALAAQGKRILVTTFTRAAREEISSRLIEKAPALISENQVVVLTLGSLAWRIANIDIVSQHEFLSWVGDAVNAHGLKAESYLAYRRLRKDRFIGELAKGIERLLSNAVYDDELNDVSDEPVRILYKDYLESGPEIQASVILQAIEALTGEEDPALKACWGSYDAIIVDEAQDITESQRLLIEAIRGCSHNDVILDYVGDADQSIYSWRGNIPEFMDPMYHSFNEEDIGAFSLTENYRSTKEILQPAIDILNYGSIGQPKELLSNRSGDDVVVYNAPTESSEAKLIAKLVEEAHNEGTPYKEMAIIGRKHVRLDVVEGALINADIPYVRVGLDYYERPDVLALILCLKIASLKGEDLIKAIYDLIYLRIEDKNIVKRLMKSIERANFTGQYEVIFKAIESSLRPAQKRLDPSEEELARQAYLDEYLSPLLLALININRNKMDDSKEILKLSIHGLQLKTWLQGNPKYHGKLKTLSQIKTDFFSLANKHPDLSDFLNALSERILDNEALTNGGDYDAVFLTTPFGAKGLEWDFVIGCGLNNNEFPTLNAQRYRPSEEVDYRLDVRHSGGMDEERRLFYVMITRARKKLFLTWPMTIKNSKTGGSFEVGISSFLKNIRIIDKSRNSLKGKRKI